MDTDAGGNYRLERVAAGQPGTVSASATDHALVSVDTGNIAAGQTCTVPTIHLPKIERKFKSVDFDATTWAIAEQTKSAGGAPTFKVNTKFGAYKGALGLTYHVAAGQTVADVDEILLWFEGGTFIQGGVSSEVGIESLVGFQIDELKVGGLKDVIEGVGRVCTVLDGINKLAAFLQGDIDPSQMQRNHEVTATYTTHTGAKPESEPLINIPTSTDIPVAVTFQGGGATIVRIDKIELSDGTNTKTLRPEWYSPGFAVYRVNTPLDLSKLNIYLYLVALNSRLETGVLGNTAQNRITWKPGQSNWLRIEGFKYY
jgi:hypothetical protein